MSSKMKRTFEHIIILFFMDFLRRNNFSFEHFVEAWSPGMSGIPPPRTSVLSDNTAVGGSQGSQPQVIVAGLLVFNHFFLSIWSTWSD